MCVCVCSLCNFDVGGTFLGVFVPTLSERLWMEQWRPGASEKIISERRPEYLSRFGLEGRWGAEPGAEGRRSSQSSCVFCSGAEASPKLDLVSQRGPKVPNVTPRRIQTPHKTLNASLQMQIKDTLCH